MKTTQFYLAICFALIATSVDVKAQQQLLNGGFEESFLDVNIYEEGYQVPMHWRFGYYPMHDGYCPYMGSLTNDSHSGEWAIALETWYCTPYNMKGHLTYAAGIPDTWAPILNDRPDQLSFYYKYNTVGGDSATFNSLLFNFPDSVSPGDPGFFEAIDTVAYLKGFIPNPVDQYTQIIANFEYLSSDVPEFLLLSFSSNNKEYSANPGTTLWIDDVELIYLNTSVGERAGSDFNIFPNPVADHFQLNQAGDVKAERMELLNHIGQSVSTLNPQDRFHAVNHLPPGMYFLQIETEKGVVVKKLVKE